MTLDEKVAQLTATAPTELFDVHGLRTDVAVAKLGNGIGYVEPHMGGFPRDAAELARLNNLVQRYLVEHTRLGIPAIMHIEALNGVNAPSFTSFPTAIGLAATWDPAGIGEMADLSRRQMRAVGLHHALSPMLDVARDARWGRVHESYGEDPYLVSALGVAFVSHLQGESLDDGVIATGKHFVGYAMGEAGLNMATVPLGPRELREVYVRPFDAAISLAGLESIMNSLSDWDGVPAAADPRIFRDLLRTELGFAGTVVSDWLSLENLVTHHRAAPDARAAAVLGLNAGIDVELPEPFAYGAHLVAAVREGDIAESLVDESVLRVLTHKFALGLFENPYVDEEPATVNLTASLGADLSLRLARESVTLLKNEAGLLPLGGAPRIAVVGPHAATVGTAFAPYTFPSFIALTRAMMRGEKSSMIGVEDLDIFGPDHSYIQGEVGDLLAMTDDEYARTAYGAISLVDALRAALPEADIRTAEGSGVTGGVEKISEALDIARDADIVVLALGGLARWFFSDRTEGEGADTADVALPAVQRQLVRSVKALGKRTVGVVFSGRPVAMGDLEPDLDAIVLGYYGSQFGTRAVADVLTGTVEPSGRLPYTIPRSSGQVPIHSGQRFGSGYRRRDDDAHGGYVDVDATPLYPLGHGLSYTTVEYSDLHASASSVSTDGQIAFTATVENTGTRPCTEIVQLYVEDEALGVVRPGLQLAGFHRLRLDPGEVARVQFTLQVAQLAYLSIDNRWVVEPGSLEVSVGRSSGDRPLRVAVDLVGEAVDVSDRRVFLSTSTESRERI